MNFIADKSTTPSTGIKTISFQQPFTERISARHIYFGRRSIVRGKIGTCLPRNAMKLQSVVAWRQRHPSEDIRQRRKPSGHIHGETFVRMNAQEQDAGLVVSSNVGAEI